MLPLIRVAMIPVALAACYGLSTVSGENEPNQISALALNTHPRLFRLILCWLADSESPVVTEISLDAVEKNRNQFPMDAIRQEEGWTVFRESNHQGFSRYRVVKSRENRYSVEYQQNDGGSLTTAVIIDCTVISREIRRDGQLASIRSLRVDAIESK